jgi:restriction system protein
VSLFDLRKLTSADAVGYLAAATFGVLLVLFVQWLAVGRKHRRRRLAWERRSSDRFRRYVGLIVPDERGTTEVDEVLVTPAGIFVIEKKDFGAWIFGSENDEHWTAVYRNGEKHQFQNPIRQNYRHIKALESYLGVPRSMLSSVVAFSRRSRFKTRLPSKVLVGDHVAFIRSDENIALNPEEFDAICSRLNVLDTSSDGAALDRHVQDLDARFESTTQCPKCGGRLVQRRSRKPGYEGNVFLGCSNFPSCRYIRNLDAI